MFSLLLLLSFVFLTSGNLTVQAIDVTDSNTINEKIYVKYDYDQETYVECNINDKDSKIAYQTDDTDIYCLDGNIYLSLTETGALQRVEKIEFNLCDTNKLTNVLNNPNIKDLVKEDLKKASDIAIVNNNNDAKVTLYIPFVSKSKAQTTTNYKSGNYKMQDILVYINNIASPYTSVSKGSNSKNIASGLYTLTLTAAGFASKTLNLVTAGISVLQGFANSNSGTISPSSQDFLQVSIIGDYSTKYTYVDDGYGFQPGTRTQSLYLRQIDTYQQYITNSVGKQYHILTNINTTYKTSNFDSPAAKAIQWRGNCFIEEINMTVYGLKIVWPI